jgi:hypothetical protein
MVDKNIYKSKIVNNVNTMKAENMWEGVRFVCDGSNHIVLRRDFYDKEKHEFLHGRAAGLFMPIRKVKRGRY